MAYQVLARKYRPQCFSDVAGQDHVTRTLLNALTQGRIAHGYIFSGHRGIGKTTIARILAMALNCRNEIGSPQRPAPEPCGICDSCTEIRAGNAVDVIEIDAATNRGIDEIRELRDAARYRPARDKYKIYILDEAHQITDAAFNALLKTLEEPPDHVVFMMATTQPEDIPQTIRSRCQHFSFHAVKFDDILAQLRSVAAREDISAPDAALALLAEAGDGSMRDALSIMDQAIASAPLVEGKPQLDAEQILELMGNVPNTVFERLLESIGANQSAAVLEEANRLINAGNSPAQIARQFVRYLRNCLMARLAGESTELMQISADERARAARSALLFSEEDLTRFLDVMLRTFDQLNYRQEQRFHLELGLMKLVHLQRLLPMEQFLSQLPLSQKTLPASGGGALPARTSQTSARQSASPAITPGTMGVTAEPAQVPAKPVPFSPFEASNSRNRTDSKPRSEMNAGPIEAGPSARTLTPLESVSQAATVIDVRPGAGDATPASARDLDRLRDIVCDALEQQGHHTASTLLANGAWSQNDNEVGVQVNAKKTMLGLTMNAEAERIIKNAIREAGSAQKLNVTPAENGSAGGPEIPPAKRPAAAGGLQAEALAHPLVKQAQELFNAEVRSVLDVRERR